MAQTRADYGTKGILSFINPDFGLNGVNNMWSTCPYLEWLHDPTIGIHTFDHFTDFVTTMRGLTVGGDATGSAAVAAGSLLRVTSHLHDEDEYGVLGTTAGTTMASGKDIWFEAMVRATQAAATSANLCVGLTDHAIADLMQDAGAGMAASHSSIVFNKVDTGTTWVAENSITVTPTEITAGTFTTGIWYRLGFKVTSNTLITWYINGVAVGSSTTTFPTAAMAPVFYAKAGTAAAEILDVDWYRMFQLS
jgi:hypothetical protein